MYCVVLYYIISATIFAQGWHYGNNRVNKEEETITTVWDFVERKRNSNFRAVLICTSQLMTHKPQKSVKVGFFHFISFVPHTIASSELLCIYLTVNQLYNYNFHSSGIESNKTIFSY